MTIQIGGDNAYFLHLYTRYLQDQTSVPADWAAYFAETEPRRGQMPDATAQVETYLAAVRRFGHLEARLNPLSDTVPQSSQLARARDALANIGGRETELSLGGRTFVLTTGEIISRLRDIYSGPLALEVAHLDNEEERDWWHTAFEAAMLEAPSQDILADALESVMLADEFESFMRLKFPTKKRFGSEGSEGAIVFIREILKSCLAAGVGQVTMGGMHRGRLSLLAVALGKSPATLAAELMGRDLSEGAEFTGDVPYHLGYRARFDGDNGSLDLTLLPHPSHLLVVAPVALGLARARGSDQADRSTAMGLLMHTDAAFSGQGLAAEILQLGELAGYTAGGTVHLVVNNQIGFTTLPSEGRSARYCTDGGKAVGIPVLHVNGDNPVAVLRAARLALEWRQRFSKDILIDLVCYRRYGHNELDEPRFTQPGMWGKIDLLPSLREQFQKSVLVKFPSLKPQIESIADAFRTRLRAGFETADAVSPNYEPVQSASWAILRSAGEDDLLETVQTGISADHLRKVGLAGSVIPKQLSPNPKVRRFYEQRCETISSGRGINFATAEALAFATLIDEGTTVRLSGQDAVRGTFTQRHMAVHDSQTGQTVLPLAAGRPGAIEVINSPLSEYAVLGYEYGHSLHNPNQLTLWEAQFGDFLNGAQVVVDQYISSAEAKWRLRSGLVVLLPHGLEGQGPDHSSARIERLLQMCAGGNMIIANPSTPANLFHLLRRQIHAEWRKPLFVIAPKSLLRAKAAVSTLEDMAQGTAFQPVITQDADPAQVRRVVLCSGKIFYAAEQARRDMGQDQSIVLIRVEQVYPFPTAGIMAALALFQGADVAWLQEEAENQGAWPYVSAKLASKGLSLALFARPALPVTAGGSVDRHDREQAELIAAALSI